MDARVVSKAALLEVVPAFAPATATLYLRSREHGAVRPKPHGSAALLAVENSRFLITARHLLDGLDPDDELVLCNAMEGRVFTLPWTESLYSKDSRHDVTALELRLSDLALFHGMRFLTLDDVDVQRPRPQHEVYSLIGYPQELAPTAHRHGRQALLVLNALISPASIHESKLQPEHQFLLDNDPLLVRDERGEPSATPDLRGVSGGPVFRTTADNGDTLLAHSAKWVGIETGFFKLDGHELIKVTGIEIVLSLIAASRPQLQGTIEGAFR